MLELQRRASRWRPPDSTWSWEWSMLLASDFQAINWYIKSFGTFSLHNQSSASPKANCCQKRFGCASRNCTRFSFHFCGLLITTSSRSHRLGIKCSFPQRLSSISSMISNTLAWPLLPISPASAICFLDMRLASWPISCFAKNCRDEWMRRRFLLLLRRVILAQPTPWAEWAFSLGSYDR